MRKDGKQRAKQDEPRLKPTLGRLLHENRRRGGWLAGARAALRDTELLLLDEPTSALDTATEQAVQQELERLMEGRTSVVVAHRLSTVRKSDRILVLEGGQVAEEGNHDSLMALQGQYYELVRNQADGEACA